MSVIDHWSSSTRRLKKKKKIVIMQDWIGYIYLQYLALLCALRQTGVTCLVWSSGQSEHLVPSLSFHCVRAENSFVVPLSRYDHLWGLSSAHSTAYWKAVNTKRTLLKTLACGHWMTPLIFQCWPFQCCVTEHSRWLSDSVKLTVVRPKNRINLEVGTTDKCFCHCCCCSILNLIKPIK